MLNAPNINLAWTMLAAEECHRLGVRHAVVSPGSRSAPLAVAFARHRGITVHIAHDERGGAFLALGLAKQSGVPAVAIMTSGTAVANALPAVVEARMTRTPLLVFAADRPPELRDCGANQAIPQSSLLDGAVRWSVDLPCPTQDIPAEFVLSTVDEAHARACGLAGSQGGGVHVNWQFREPLAPEARPWDVGWLWSVARWSKDRARRPWRTSIAAPASEIVVQSGVVIAGRAPVTMRASLARWKGTLLADVTSGLARGGTAGADLVLRSAFDGDNRALLKELEPSEIVVAGDAVVSKRMHAWIAQHKGPVTVVGPGDPRVDPSHRANTVVSGASAFVGAAGLRPHPAWRRALTTATRAARKALDGERVLCEPSALADTTEACSEHAHGTIFYGSSMPIRDADFLSIHPPRGWDVGSNRGASGIDGLVATATGHALASALPVVAFIGDVSALHDLNSLQLASKVQTPLVLVVLNNDGGGIFRYLPIARHADVFEQCFVTPHGRAIAPFAKAFGIASESPTTRAAMSKSVAKALRRAGATLLEVTCTRESSETMRTRVATAAMAALAQDFH